MEINAILLSAIIPVYNSQKYLRRILGVLEKQLYSNIELILVDDGSEDGSYSVLYEYSEKYENIKVLRQENSGAASARQYGINVATGKYITFIDSDDIVDEKYFLNIIQILDNNPNRDMYVLSYETYYSSGNIIEQINEDACYNSGCDYMQAIFDRKIKGENALWNHIYSRKFIVENDIAFETENKIAEDCLFNDLCINKVSSVCVSKYKGYTWICDHESLTGKCPDNMWETLNNHIKKLEAFKNKYAIEHSNAEKYIYEIKVWAFTYLVNNIFNSKRSIRYKHRYYKCILENNIDESTILRMYTGIRQKFLLQAKRHSSVFWFHLWHWSDWNIFKVKIIMKIVNFYHLFIALCKKGKGDFVC